MKRIELNTERLILKELSQRVYNYVFKKLDKEKGMAFLNLNSERDYLLEKEKYSLGFTTHNKKLFNFQIQHKKELKIIGWCGYHTWYTEHHRAEIGYALTEDKFKGMGLMSEAIERIIRYGFEVMELNRIEAFIGPSNQPSLKLIKKMKFIEEGKLRQHYLKNNQHEDSIVFSLLKNEYNNNSEHGV